MGQTLSEPITTKTTASHSNRYFKVTSSTMQGWRINMEDAHVTILGGVSSLGAGPSTADPKEGFFGVFDGHGGSTIAQYVGSHLHRKFMSLPAYARGDYDVALKQTFLALDHEMACDPKMKDEVSGTTAVCVLIKNNKIFCANVGDSRAIASQRGNLQLLSFDHKPNNDEEMKRIVAAGGFVEFNRVNGNLALSRALGDFMFKKNDKKSPEDQIVCALPDLIVKDLTDSFEFVVIACDGIWDVMTNEEVLRFVRARIAQLKDPAQICEELLNTCLAPDNQMGGLGCDNMTVILVCLLNGGTYEQLAARCKHPSMMP